jgi:DNA mismatch endonuclease (patch repair protein)
VFSKRQAIFFVHGYFWHRHEGCRYKTTPSTRPEFLAGEVDVNVIRDAAIRDQLI